ncbi:MAG: hypothetical protein NWS19_00555 [Crocinitomicaceae bacterium]|nr:hypothetical protein [Crocinitomicaceae bacterium]
MAAPQQHTRIKKALFIVALALLLLPWLEQNEHFLKLAPLGGAQQLAPNVAFSAQNWKSTTFQEGQQAYVRDHFGARSFFIRLYNELNDQLFGEFKANGVIRGKDGYLFEENYLLAASGKDFLGADSIGVLIAQLQQIEQSLQQKGKHLLVCLAPGKGSFFPQKMPSSYRYEKQLRNHPYFAKAIQEAKIPLFDIQSWFEAMKPSAPYPLFPKNGIHWSSYGEYLVADSLIRRVGHLSKHPFARLALQRIETSTQLRDRDEDIELGMNLLRNLPDFQMAYPKFEIVKKIDKKAKRVLVIGDSFFYGMYNWGIMEQVFADGQFWYYNNEILVPKAQTRLVETLPHYRREVEKFDVVVLLLTEANLPRFGFGMQQAYLRE